MTDRLTILTGDCRAMLRTLSDESVHCVVTSPPYWGLRDYGTEPQVWGGDLEHQHQWADQTKRGGGAYKEGSKKRWQHSAKDFARDDRFLDGHPEIPAGAFCECGAWRGSLGLEPTPYLYVEHILEVFQEARRVLRKDGTLWLNLGDCYATGAGRVGEHPGGGEQGARWKGDIDRLRDSKRAYRDDSKNRGTSARCDGRGGHKYRGPMTQPNRMPIPGLKPKDLVGIPWRVAFALQSDGWWLRSDIIWNKPNAMPESVTDRPTRSHEYLFLLSKSERYYYDQNVIAEEQSENERTRRLREQQEGLRTRYSLRRDEPHGQVKPGQNGCVRTVEARQALALKGTRNRRSVWTVPTEPYADAHFATFPTRLVEPCIRAGCPVGGVVLDPFGGSGTTGKVALEHGRRAILIELSTDYVRLIDRRCETTYGLGLA